MVLKNKVTECYNPILQLSKSYEFLCDVLNNPLKSGYIRLIKKIKPRSRPPLNLNLLEFKIKIDKEILELNRKILKWMNIE